MDKGTYLPNEDINISWVCKHCSFPGIFEQVVKPEFRCFFSERENLSLWNKVGLVTEAETAAAHQPPYATASYRSTQFLSKTGTLVVH